jgi:hypothetical protein
MKCEVYRLKAYVMVWNEALHLLSTVHLGLGLEDRDRI